MEARKPDDVIEWVKERRQSAQEQRQDIARCAAEDACFYEGLQWIKHAGHHSPTWFKRSASYGADDKLLVQVNDITRLVQKSAASTKPNRLEIDARPYGQSVIDEATASAHERFAQLMIDRSAYLRAAARANFKRVVSGQWGLGLTIRATTNSASTPDAIISAFDFDPTELILDPHEQSRNLEDHSEVVWESVWTARRIEEVFGIKLDHNMLKTIGELEPTKVAVGQVSENRMYAHYARHSRSKGARICQIHVKGDGGRFDRMYVVVEEGDKEKIVNFDNPVSPFGGTAMPLQILFGHYRTDSIWGISDVQMMKETQRLRNLVMTLWVRALQRFGHSRVVVDRRAFGPRIKTDEEIAGHFSNRPFEITVVDGGDRNRNIAPITYVQQPEPPRFALDYVQQSKADMLERVHKAEAHFGPTPLKSHVTEGVANRALDFAGQVDDDRVVDDVQVHMRLVSVLHATGVKMASAETPTVAQWLVRAGFDEMDIGAIAMSDSDAPPVTFHIRESSVRHRPHRQREAELANAFQMQAMTPVAYRMALARDLESPLTTVDRSMYDSITKAVSRIIIGEVWQPIPMGEYAEEFMSACRRAYLEQYRNPDAQKRLGEAMAAQIALEQALMPQDAQGVDSTGASQPMLGQAFSPADMLESMSAQVAT